MGGCAFGGVRKHSLSCEGAHYSAQIQKRQIRKVPITRFDHVVELTAKIFQKMQ